MTKIAVKSLPITLVQFLKWAGLTRTGGDAKAAVREGLVRLNGRICDTPGKRLAVGDKVELAGELVELCLDQTAGK